MTRSSEDEQAAADHIIGGEDMYVTESERTGLAFAILLQLRSVHSACEPAACRLNDLWVQDVQEILNRAAGFYPDAADEPCVCDTGFTCTAPVHFRDLVLCWGGCRPSAPRPHRHLTGDAGPCPSQPIPAAAFSSAMA